MILHTVRMGAGRPAVLLHGLFGASGNFGAIQRRLAEGREIFAFDLRNHGASPHDPAMSYALMAGDVLETMRHHGLEKAALIGHSMGGKVAMETALLQPERVTRLLVADIAPVANPPTYRPIAQALLNLPLGLSRAEADRTLSVSIPDRQMRGFLLMNLRFGSAPGWRIGLPEIAAALPTIEGWDPPPHSIYPGPVLVLRGELSEYVQPAHRPAFRALFPAAQFASLRGAGHWLHADAPDAFVSTVGAFLDRDSS